MKPRNNERPRGPIKKRNIVEIEFETAIRRESCATPQVGRKSLQKVFVDFDAGSIRQSVRTGKTKLGPISLGSIRDGFLVKQLSMDKSSAWFSVKGETASAVVIMPNINYEFSVIVSLLTKTVTITGNHDGFPSYKIQVEGGTVYDYTQGHIGQLFGDSDVSVIRTSIPWGKRVGKKIRLPSHRSKASSSQ